MPKSVAIGTNPPGTVFYALASGLAKVASAGVPFQIGVQPYTGTSTFIPLLNNGELDFGVNNAVDMVLTYRGANFKIGGRNPFTHSPNIRVVMRGAPLLIAPAVRKDSPIKSIHDVKGKRVTGEYPAQLAVWYNMFGILANAGLTWSDVKVVPVPAANEGVDALAQGRADAAVHAVGSAKIKETDAAVGVRHISLDCSREGDERMKKAVPGYYLAPLKAGSFTGIVEDICVQAYDIYFTTHKALPDAVVLATLKTIWENIDKLPPLHPVFKQWTRERAVSSEVTIPYHPGAVRFYKERDVWSAKMDETQRKLLALNP
jgi:TRAP transporter TAXI family solute receptor